MGLYRWKTMQESDLFKELPRRSAWLEGKVRSSVALIAGDSRGIGEKTVRLFISHGAKVVIADILDNLGHSLCKEIGLGENVSFIHCDITEENDVNLISCSTMLASVANLVKVS
ncbi:hypothetical protein IFM89_036680 [Coptis chinensis]|uniref:Uncharacterized protein n=1 Tax=Coptis chinensis TaxID=261450 RepID=A0A835I840_9MAGN|nr:hypothetical protein IFM89_036680 [Coptis chinensis]